MDVKDHSTLWTDIAGVFGGVFAALCCMGAPMILSVLAAVGLGWIRRDSILWPLMFASLAIALWGFWRGRRQHGVVPVILTGAGAVAVVAGVVFVHGPIARQLIVAGSIVLIAAMFWNVWARRRWIRLACSEAAILANVR